jgi:2-alkyl-3-oxoalkanoate reductase
MRVYLTGGTGLLGTHIAEQVSAEDAPLRALTRPTSDRSYLDKLGVETHEGDILDVDSMVAGMRGCEAVVHAASPTGRWGPPALFEANTVRGTENVIAAMEKAGVRRLVHISTISVHGLDPVTDGPVSEANGFGRHFLPFDYYGRAKVRAEQAVERAHERGNVQATVLRPGWLYGPRDSSYGQVADLARLGIATRIGSGDNRIPLAYAGNIARAVWLALSKPSESYRVYLCAYDGRVSQNDYLASVARATGTRRTLRIPRGVLLKLAAVHERISALLGYRLPVLMSRYVVHLIGSDWRFEQSRIGRELEYSPAVGYAEGFARTEDWYRTSRGRA